MKTSVFDTPAPLLSKNEAGKIALKYFAIDGTVESLVSDRDQNFKIIARSDAKNVEGLDSIHQW